MFSKNYEMVRALDLSKSSKTLFPKKVLLATLLLAVVLSLTGIQGAMAQTENPAAEGFLVLVNDEAEDVEVVSNEPFSVTVKALDENYQVLTGYVGTISFESSQDEVATLPDDYTFTATDKGVKTFDLGFTLVETGTHDLTVTDADNPLAFGMIDLTVTGATPVTPQADTPVILTPGDGETLNTANVDIVGTAPSNTEVSIWDGTVQKGTAETDSEGNFSFTAEDLFDGTHTFTVKAEVNGQTVSSAQVQVSIDTTAPIIQKVTLTPATATPGEKVNVAVETEGSIETLKVIVDQRTVTLTEGSIVGSYEGNFIAPALAGEYTVDIEVTDRAANTDTYYDQTTLTVREGTPNVAPTVTVTATPSTGTAPLSISLTATATDSDGTVATYLWNFGDNSSTSTLANPSHTYTTAGVYTATVTVTDDKGANSSASTAITVSTGVTQPPPATADNGPAAWALTIILALLLAYPLNRRLLKETIK